MSTGQAELSPTPVVVLHAVSLLPHQQQQVIRPAAQKNAVLCSWREVHSSWQIFSIHPAAGTQEKAKTCGSHVSQYSVQNCS